MHGHLTSAGAPCLVVGASGMIGGAVARRLGAAGRALVLQYCTNQAAAAAVAADVAAAGGQAVCVRSALDSEEACRVLWAEAESHFGHPAAVALCGGRVPWQDWPHVSPENWQEVLFEHCIVPFMLTQLAVPALRARDGGAIVYVSSVAAKYGGSTRTIHYAASKAALETAMRGVARQVASAGVRINGVRAGFVQTPQQSGRSASEIEQRIRMIPMARAGTAEEIAAAVVFLLSDDARFITGEIVTVAGGD